MIRAVIFDFGQTLVDSAGGFKEAEKKAQKKLFSDIFQYIGNNAEKAGIQGRFLTVYRRNRTAFHKRSEFSRPAMWSSVYRHFSKTPPTGKLERWENEYWETVKSMTVPFPETAQVLERLSRSYRLALITNTQGLKVSGNHRMALFPEIEKWFETIIVAGEEGVPPKPDPIPFRLCLKRLGIKPSKAVYIGDDFQIDIRGASEAGLHPVWLQHRSVKRNWPDMKSSVPVITDLTQLASDVL